MEEKKRAVVEEFDCGCKIYSEEEDIIVHECEEHENTGNLIGDRGLPVGGKKR